MTNLQQTQDGRETGFSPEQFKRLWLWAPIAAASLLAAALLLGVALPQWLAISRDQKRLNELEEQSQQATLLKLQTLKVQRQRQQVQRQQEQLIQLVTGKGDSQTYLATLDLEAVQSGVKLQLFEPTENALKLPGKKAASKTAAKPVEDAPEDGGGDGTAKGGAKAKANGAASDPMRQAGLRGQPVLLAVRGPYPKVLDFLRRMEMLDVLAEQKVLTVSLEGLEFGRRKPNSKELPPLLPEVEVRVGLTIYSKGEAENPAGARGETGAAAGQPRGAKAGPKGDDRPGAAEAPSAAPQ